MRKIQTKRPFLSEMMKNSRKANRDKPLPPPQDVKLRMITGQKIRLSFTRFPEDLIRKNGGIPDLEKKPIFSNLNLMMIGQKYYGCLWAET